MPYTIIIASAASDSAVNQYLTRFCRRGYRRVALGERHEGFDHFRRLSKHAVAYRRVSLVVGREAYPDNVFYLQMRLLEWAARLCEKYGNALKRRLATFLPTF